MNVKVYFEGSVEIPVDDVLSNPGNRYKDSIKRLFSKKSIEIEWAQDEFCSPSFDWEEHQCD